MKTITALCVLFLVGCGGGSEQSTTSYQEKIRDLQKREATCPSIETVCTNSNDIRADIFLVIEQLPPFKWINEEGDHWNASCETLRRPIGECDDIAPMICRAIADSCVMENYDAQVFLRLTDTGNSKHMVCVVYHGGHDYEIEDGFISEHNSDKILAEFNIY